MIIMSCKPGHIHSQFRIWFLFSNWFNNLIRVDRINFLYSCMLMHWFLYRRELKFIQISTYIKYFIVRAHSVVRASIVTINVHLQFWEFFSICSLFFVNLGLFLFNVIIILITHNHLSCHTFARSDLDIWGVIGVSSGVTGQIIS